MKLVLQLTQTRVQHVQCHRVALLSAGDGDESFVAVVLWFVDLDDRAAELADLVDLGTTFANDGAHHVVRDEDLLGQRLSGHGSLDWLLRGSGVIDGRTGLVVASMWLRLVRPCTSVALLR